MKQTYNPSQEILALPPKELGVMLFVPFRSCLHRPIYNIVIYQCYITACKEVCQEASMFTHDSFGRVHVEHSCTHPSINLMTIGTYRSNRTINAKRPPVRSMTTAGFGIRSIIFWLRAKVKSCHFLAGSASPPLQGAKLSRVMPSKCIGQS